MDGWQWQAIRVHDDDDIVAVRVKKAVKELGLNRLENSASRLDWGGCRADELARRNVAVAEFFWGWFFALFIAPRHGTARH